MRAVALLAGVILFSAASDPNEGHRAHCLRAPTLTIYQGSVVTADHQLRPGSKAECMEAGLAPLLFALELLPAKTRPERVLVHTNLKFAAGAPPLTGVVYHRPSKAFLVGTGQTSFLSETIWLHELAHAAMHGARPEGRLGGALIGAFEEGVADYFAAALSGSARVGSTGGGELRDLSQPGSTPASEWAALAVPGAFSTHRFGKSLGAALFQLHPTPGTLLLDLIACLKSEQPWLSSDLPNAVLREFVGRCAVRSRSALESVLTHWIPSELYSP